MVINLTIDTTYTQTHNMYQIRRFIIHVQNMREGSLLRPWDKITVYVLTDNEDFIGLLKSYQSQIYDRLKSTVVIESESQVSKIHYSKYFDWNYHMLSDEVTFMPVIIEKVPHDLSTEY